jgi:SAM-dependent methyltransferase
MAQDSSKAEFWETRYRDHVTPWDAGKVPASLRHYVPNFQPAARVLIPGCGFAHEATFLADQGFDVLAIDFSPAAIATAQKTSPRLANLVRLADFFKYDFGKPFDVIYERAFLCALPRTMWNDYAKRSAQLLKPGGIIAGFFFFADTPRGPPFGTSRSELQALLGRCFTLTDDQPVMDSIEVFSGKERWMVWRRAENETA